MSKIEDIIVKYKRIATNAINRCDYESALEAVSCTARLLNGSNLHYRDDDLENMLHQLSGALIAETAQCDQNVVLFYDGFGFDTRGLAQIYLRALCHHRKVVYVTYKNRENNIPTIKQIVSSTENEYRFLDAGPFVESIRSLHDIVRQYRPRYFILYTVPEEVVATTLLNAYGLNMNRYLINLTDHAYWLGTGCIDYSIEFRDYGAIISRDYRGIPEDRIVKIPFYPIIDTDREFAGFPFAVQNEQKVIFSGGALYKTLGANNRYYEIVEKILSYPDTIFWYAGEGDTSEIDRLIRKYPGRCYLTPERQDLYQVLQHCYFYLSTYPLCGGLMFQYAALAGKIPLTLSNGDVTDGFLIHQGDLGVQFKNIEDLYDQIDRLLSDEEYTYKYSDILRRSVISATAFANAVNGLWDTGTSEYPIKYHPINVTDLNQWYLDVVTEETIDALIAVKKHRKLIKYAPMRYLRSGCRVVARKWHQRTTGQKKLKMESV